MNFKNFSRILCRRASIISLLIAITVAGQLHATSKSEFKVYTKFDKTGDISVEPRLRKKHYPFGVKFKKARPPQFIYLVPAHFGGTIFTALGAFVAWPFSAAYNAFSGDTSRWDLTPPVPWASQTIGLGGAYLFGSPFWCLEQAFWEFPVWLFSSKEKTIASESPAPSPRNSNYRLGTGI